MESKIVWNCAKNEDRPETYKYCLLTVKTETIFGNDDCTNVILGYWDGKRWEVNYGEKAESRETKVIYWAYMPEPPTED